MGRGIIWKTETGLLFNLFRLACYGVILTLVVGFAGSMTPVGDSLAVFRRELSLLCAALGLIALALGKRRLPAIAFGTTLFSAFSLYPWMEQPKSVNPTFSLHQHNVFFDNPDLSALFETVRDSGADILTFQEVGTKTRRYLEAVSEDYEHFQQCFYGNGGVAVMAKDLGPLVGHGCAEKGKLAWIRLHTDIGPVTFASIHQLWPWPSGQYWQSERLAEELEQIPRPIVMAGDFNMVPWAATTRLLAEAAGGEIATGLEPTFSIANDRVGLRIDNVVAPKGAKMRVTTRPQLGSDHAGLWAEIEFTPDLSDKSGNSNAGGFALFGGPHILTLVTEVATRALKAVRFQKFNNHLRLRPETLAARIERANEIEAEHIATAGLFTGLADDIGDTVQAIRDFNPGDPETGAPSALLPMAFAEGSPMHPS